MTRRKDRTELCHDKKKGQDRIMTEQEERIGQNYVMTRRKDRTEFEKLKEERIGQNQDRRANQI